MPAKKQWIPIKQILFTYLALSKILYWVETAFTMEQNDWMGVFNAVLMRLLNRDIMLVASIMLMFALDKLIMKKSEDENKTRYATVYVIGYVGMIGLFYLYGWVLNWFITVHMPSLRSLVSSTLVGYVVAMIALNIKYYLKAKEKETYESVKQRDDTLPAPGLTRPKRIYRRKARQKVQL